MSDLGPSEGGPLTEEQQRLVRASRGLVERVASLLAPRFPSVGRDEAVSLGHAALVDAARRYDPSQGTPFEGYAWACVHWSVYKGLKREAVSLRRPLAAARRAGYEAAALPAPPDNPLTDTETQVRARLEAMCDDIAGAMVAASVGEASRMPPSEEAFADHDAWKKSVEALERATMALSERDRKLLRMRYHEDRDFYAIAEALNVSYATVRRHHQSALRRLAAAMRSRLRAA